MPARRQPLAELAVVVEQHASLMDHEHGDSEMTQGLPGRYLRILGHGGAPVYRAFGGLDDGLTLALNRAMQRSPRLARLVGAAARGLAGVEVGLMLLLALTGRRRSALEMLTYVGVVYVICEALGRLWPRRRPFERLFGVRSPAPHSPGRSFPSRHVASGLVMAAIGGEEHSHLGALMSGVAWLLGLSRVLVGLHYPSDVVAGALLALVTTTVRRTL